MTSTVQAHLPRLHLLVLLIRVWYRGVEHLNLVNGPLVRRLDCSLHATWAQLVARLLGQVLRKGVKLKELSAMLRAGAWQALHLGVVAEGLWVLGQAMLVDLPTA